MIESCTIFECSKLLKEHGKLSMKDLESQLAGLQSQHDDLKTSFDNLVRIVRDNVKTKSSKVKQKDAEGNVEYEDSVYDACEKIKP